MFQINFHQEYKLTDGVVHPFFPEKKWIPSKSHVPFCDMKRFYSLQSNNTRQSCFYFIHDFPVRN